MARGDEFLWRIAKHTATYAADDLTGGGAKITGGRWNRKGNAVLYTSRSIALATLETLAHTTDSIAVRNAFLVKITVPASVWRLRHTLEADGLPVTWKAEPAGSATLDLGDAWLEENATPLLAVPSVIVPEEHNVLINPRHPAAKRLHASILRQFVYDPRL